MALNISRGRIWTAQKIVVYGPEGIGKSFFASQFPDPVFIDTEGSTKLLDVARLPRPTSWTTLLNMVKEVKDTRGACKTLVIDTMDWAEQLCVAHICATYNKKGVEDFGYGKGYVYVKEEIGRFLNLLTEVIESGVNVVLTAHSQVKKFELPDECGAYDRYELKLGNKTGGNTAAMVKEWADIVLFANYKQYVVEVNEKKKAQGGARIMHTQHHPCWDAKNRHDLKPELPFDYNQIAYCIPNHTDDALLLPPVYQEPAPDPVPVQQPAPAAVAETIKKAEEADKELKKVVEELKTPAKASTSEKQQPKEDKRAPDDLKDLPKPLADLMAANEVKPTEIQDVVSLKGYYPKDTPIKNYDPGFIDGVLIGAWDQVFGMVKEQRQIPFK